MGGVMPHAAARKKHKRELLRAHKLGEAGKFTEAEAIYRRYHAKYPTDPQVLFNLGVLVQRRADNPAERSEAMNFYTEAIDHAGHNGQLWIAANAMNNMGLIMGKINRPDKAGICFGLALQMNPTLNAARINYADVLRHDGEYEKADEQFAEVLRLDPGSDAARFSAGMIALLLGDYKRGFDLYEARFGVASFPTRPFKTNKPKWNNQDLNDQTLLISEEQGFGDTFMFSRYFRELKKKWPTATVWFRGNELYRNISKGMLGLDRFFSITDPIPDEFDYHIHLISLPHLFGTTLETIPADAPWITTDAWPATETIAPDTSHLSPLTSHPSGRKVGLCWAGSPRHGKDAWRSLPPEAFAPIIDAHPFINFYSLQIGPRAEEFSALLGAINHQPSTINLFDLAPHITDFVQTAQIIQQLDLVISVDTAIVHLAGALDKPCWMLTPFSPDFRWMLRREDSPWYPKLRLFRQDKPDNWDSVIEKILTELGSSAKHAKRR